MRARAFTLVELLVVIGIIALIAGIAIPMSMKAYRAADKNRTAADLTTITVALEAFKGDFEDYPRPTSPGNNTGFAALGRYLIGPYGSGTLSITAPSTPIKVGDAYYTGSSPNIQEWVCIKNGASASPATPDWHQQSVFDGKDGPGMKKPVGGRVYGPYLQPDKFKTRGLAILDRNGNPILYFPARSTKSNVSVAGGYAFGAGSNYNLDDGELPFRVSGESDSTNSVGTMQMMLGDTNRDGAITGGETQKATGAFILWSAGADGIYGPPRASGTFPTQSQIDKCDDVTNLQ